MYRSVQRLRINAPLKLNDQPVGICRNLSTRGAFVESAERPEMGVTHRASVIIDGKLFERTARVVRHDADGFALEFEDVGARVDRELDALLEKTS